MFRSHLNFRVTQYLYFSPHCWSKASRWITYSSISLLTPLGVDEFVLSIPPGALGTTAGSEPVRLCWYSHISSCCYYMYSRNVFYWISSSNSRICHNWFFKSTRLCSLVPSLLWLHPYSAFHYHGLVLELGVGCMYKAVSRRMDVFIDFIVIILHEVVITHQLERKGICVNKRWAYWKSVYYTHILIKNKYL